MGREDDVGWVPPTDEIEWWAVPTLVRLTGAGGGFIMGGQLKQEIGAGALVCRVHRRARDQEKAPRSPPWGFSVFIESEKSWRSDWTGSGTWRWIWTGRCTSGGGCS